MNISKERIAYALKRYDELCERENAARERGNTRKADRLDALTEGMEIAFNKLGIPWVPTQTF